MTPKPRCTVRYSRLAVAKMGEALHVFYGPESCDFDLQHVLYPCSPLQ